MAQQTIDLDKKKADPGVKPPATESVRGMVTEEPQPDTAPAPAPPPVPAEPAPPTDQLALITQRLAKLEAVEKVDAVPFQPRDTAELYRFCRFLAKSTLLPLGLRGYKSADTKWQIVEYSQERIIANLVLVCAKGLEIGGLAPLQSIGGINIIDGKAEVGSSVIHALLLKSGLLEYGYYVDISHDPTDYRATWVYRRRGWPEGREARVTWDITRAKQMGLHDKGGTEERREANNWRKQGATMCKRRCISEAGRDDFADITLGLYDHEELQEMREVYRVDATTTVMEPAEPTERPATVKERAAAKAKANRATPEKPCLGCGGPIPLGKERCPACENDRAKDIGL